MIHNLQSLTAYLYCERESLTNYYFNYLLNIYNLQSHPQIFVLNNN